MLKQGELVVVKRKTGNEVGKILDITKFKQMRTYTVRLESGTSLQFVRVNRHDNYCAAYIDTKLSKIFNEGKKI